MPDEEKPKYEGVVPKYEGVVIRLGGRDLTIPSLSVGQAKRLWPQILELDSGITVQNLPQKHEQSIEIILAAVNRNYPEITREQLEEWIDLGNIRRVLLVVSGQSGMRTGGAEPVAVEETTVVH